MLRPWRARSGMATASATAEKIAGRSKVRQSRDCHVRAASMRMVSTAMATNSQTVPGSRPRWNSASVIAPSTTNSPCGTNNTRVTRNTSRMATANSA